MTDMFANATPNFSFEIFPPKGAGKLSSIFETVDALASLHPDLISVTYGAGGSSRDNTIEIASTKMVSLKGGGLTLVPYFAWCHRGAGEMQTWFAERPDLLRFR